MNNKEKYFLVKLAESNSTSGSYSDSYGTFDSASGAQIAPPAKGKVVKPTVPHNPGNVSKKPPVGSPPPVPPVNVSIPAPAPPPLTGRAKWQQDRANAAGRSAIDSYNKRYGTGSWGTLDSSAQSEKLKKLLGNQFPHYTGG